MMMMMMQEPICYGQLGYEALLMTHELNRAGLYKTAVSAQVCTSFTA
jgi:hypothetical protein